MATSAISTMPILTKVLQQPADTTALLLVIITQIPPPQTAATLHSLIFRTINHHPRAQFAEGSLLRLKLMKVRRPPMRHPLVEP